MKPLAIISILCLMFIIVSGLTTSPKALISPSEAILSKSESAIKQPLALDRKKLKSKAIPNWQRVIPGMFR